MNFQPLKDRIIVAVPKLAEKVLDSGLILRAEGQEKSQTGEVLAVGSEVKDVKVGNEVIFGKHDGTSQTIEGQEVLIMRESSIWGILNA